MKFSLKTLMLAVPIALVVLYFFDTTCVIMADGGYDVEIEVVGIDQQQIESITYLPIRSEMIVTVVDNFPFVETRFHELDNGVAAVRIPWSSSTSRLSGRQLRYGETYDTVIFRVDYQEKEPEFVIFELPEHGKRGGLKLVL